MVNPWHLLAVLLAIAVAFAASVTYVLFLDAQGSDALAARQVQNSIQADRNDCNAILGTAYRSDAERRWFSDNCSSWSASVGDVPDPGAPATQVQASGPGPDGRDCGQVRGTPYRSDAERAWYGANCPAQAAAAAPASAGPDRTDCNLIRGTAYRSDAERAWYGANCPAQTAAAAPASAGPDRTDCNTIRGTAYRSDAERAWYGANCLRR